MQAQTYLDECINNLRIALYSSNDKLTPQLQYMLGSAYFYKNTITTHYYADLAVKYLLLAQKNGYESNDIAEYLGLSYDSLGMTMESISAFTEKSYRPLHREQIYVLCVILCPFRPVFTGIYNY